MGGTGERQREREKRQVEKAGLTGQPDNWGVVGRNRDTISIHQTYIQRGFLNVYE